MTSSTDILRGVAGEYSLAHHADGGNRDGGGGGALGNRGGRNGRPDDDDRTFDYGDRDDHLERNGTLDNDDDDDDADDDDDLTNISYGARQRRDAERIARSYKQAGANDEYARSSRGNNIQPRSISESPLINTDDMEHYSRSFDSPVVRAGLGVIGVAAVGTVCMMSSVGLAVGAAAVGAGVVAMQMPEEERTKLHEKAKKRVNEIHDKAVDASEKLGSSCAVRYRESGMADHLEPCFPINQPPSHADLESTKSENPRSRRSNPPSGASPDPLYPGPSHPTTTNDVGHGEGTGGTSPASQFNLRFRHKKVACLRNVRIVPVGQIHGLDPQSQPKAWLDVLASANTSLDEKIEAMEEIAILAKDKRLARVFLDEGILDFFLFNIRLHQQKVRGKETGEGRSWRNQGISLRELQTTRLAAQCCMTLGKAHCAAMHTEGDLLLMSMYDRGTVPEERQVAQMLVEVPHHVRVTKTDDPTIVEPSKEVFSLKQMALSQAEEMAHSIQNLAVGR